MSRASTAEPIVPLPADRSAVSRATHLRSTIISSSIAALRELGFYEAYVAQLDAQARDEVLSIVPGVWVPMALGFVHYTACDRLRLPVSDLLALGSHAGERVMRSPLSVAMTLAKESGVTPWTMFAQSQRLWERSFQGSAIGVFKLGPKEARAEIVGWPLARIEYNRVSVRGILAGLAQPFCTRVYVSEVTPLCTTSTCGYRVAWA
jgi:hypothetical protein